jgi:stage IV sporulation protein FB
VSVGDALGPGRITAHGIFFWLFGNIVRVRYSFFLVVGLLGLSGRRDLPGFLVWMGVAFVSILLHELGHAATARACGLDPVIDIHTMGGTTSWRSPATLAWPRRLAITLAGPAVGLALGLLVLGVDRSTGLGDGSRLLRLLVYDLLWINIGWSLFNLLPMLPLDGGTAVSVVLERVMSHGSRRASLGVSIVTGVLTALVAVALGQTWMAALSALFAYNAVQQLRGQPGIQIAG